MKELRNYRKLVNDLYAEVVPPEQWNRLFADALSTYREQHGASPLMTVMTEDWCGDSACNLPLFTRMADSAGIEFRIFRSSDFPALKEYYTNRDVTHIPVLSFWDPSGDEFFRWVERPAACAAPADTWKTAHPEFHKLRKASDRESKREFARLYREFLEARAGWYRDGLWDESAREVAEGVAGKI